jgi:hypothetical protein
MGIRHAVGDDPVFWVLVILFIGIPTSYIGAVFVHHQIAVHECHAKGPGYELGDAGICTKSPAPGKDRRQDR